MSVLRSIVAPDQQRSAHMGLDWDEWVQMFTLGNFPALSQTLVGDRERVTTTYAGLATGAYMGNGVVFSCMLARMLLFSEARFQWQQLRGGQPGDLFGTPALQVLERPEPGKVTADLLTRTIVDADLGGNAFHVLRPGPRIKRLRPDWTWLVLGSRDQRQVDPDDVDAEVVGLAYQAGGPGGEDVQTFLPEEFAHFAPIPDPLAHYRGMSWITPVVREVMADTSASRHKLNFFDRGATPNMLIHHPFQDPVKLNAWLQDFRAQHEGVSNAYRSLALGPGFDATVVGSNFQQIDFKITQGAGETRVAAASGVHPTIVGLSEGLAGSSLNEGNFDAAARLTANKMLRPNWGNLAGSLETIVPPLPATRLWYDDRHVPFLAEDIKVAAEVLATLAGAMRQLADGGWMPDAVVEAVTSGDLRRLASSHTGYLPVQLQSAPPSTPAEAMTTFWPVSGQWGSQTIKAGTLLPWDHPLVVNFPSIFEPAAAGTQVPALPATVLRVPELAATFTNGKE